MEVIKMTKAQKSAEYYRLAYQCEELKAKGCNNICAQCPLYLPNYTSFYNEDQCGIALIQTSAAIDFNHTQAWQQEERRKNIIWGIVFLGLLAWGVFSFRSCVTPSQKPLPIALQELSELSIPSQTLKPYTPRVHNVYEYLERTKRTIRDVNNDGVINCIDYAVVFYMMTNPSTRLIQNDNPHTGMNHLFIGMPIGPGGSMVYIEPQVSRSHTSFRMENVWGSKYNPAYNVDVTDAYTRGLGISWK